MKNVGPHPHIKYSLYFEMFKIAPLTTIIDEIVLDMLRFLKQEINCIN